MVDPIEGRYGSLVMSGWVAPAPSGQDEAFLLLTTPDDRAAVTMPIVASVLGLAPGTVAPAADAVVELGDDGWVTVFGGGERWSRPVVAEWAEVAVQRMRVMLVVGMAPRPVGIDDDAYTDRYGADAALGFAPLRLAHELT